MHLEEATRSDGVLSRQHCSHTYEQSRQHDARAAVQQGKAQARGKEGSKGGRLREGALTSMWGRRADTYRRSTTAPELSDVSRLASCAAAGPAARQMCG